MSVCLCVHVCVCMCVYCMFACLCMSVCMHAHTCLKENIIWLHTCGFVKEGLQPIMHKHTGMHVSVCVCAWKGRLVSHIVMQWWGLRDITGFHTPWLSDFSGSVQGLKPGLNSEISFDFSCEKNHISFFSLKTFLYTQKDFLIGFMFERGNYVLWPCFGCQVLPQRCTQSMWVVMFKSSLVFPRESHLFTY